MAKWTIYCRECKEPIEAKKDLAVNGFLWPFAYHFLCHREKQERKYEIDKKFDKNAKPDFSIINEKNYSKALTLIFIFAWLPGLLSLFVPGFGEFLNELCKRDLFGETDGCLPEGAQGLGGILAIFFFPLMGWPFVLRFLSWLLYERNF